MGKLKNFKILKNFLKQDEIDLISTYLKIKHRTNFHNFDPQIQNEDTYFYGDCLTESLLLNRKSFLEKETNITLLPTYSFWRMCTKYYTLAKHVDRDSCEISVSTTVCNDGTKWPLFVNNKKIILNPGDAVLYRGCDIEHYREEFLGDYQGQIMLHYVDANGSRKENYMDKRRYWGLKAVNGL